MVAIDNSTIRAKTLDRFEQSELARAKALELGKSRKEAHEAAKTIWNDWAEEALAERKALEKAGHWPDSSLSFHELGDRNGKFESWAERYSTSFFSCTFSTKKPNFAEETRDIKNNDIDSPLDVRSLRLQKRTKNIDRPLRVKSRNTTLPGEGLAEYESSDNYDRYIFSMDDDIILETCSDEVNFRGFIFPFNANFRGSVFQGNADFTDTIFDGESDFSSAHFESICRFTRSKFHGDAIFWKSEFDEIANFIRTEFNSMADFTRTQFNERTLFYNALFKNDVHFLEANFDEALFLMNCQFKKSCNVRSVSMRGSLDMSGAEFNSVPDFTQTSLSRTPRLDNVVVGRGSVIGPIPDRSHEESWLPFIWLSKQQVDRDAPAKFRELKRMAIQGEDHRSELQFHAHEIRTARFVNDWPHQPRFWFGIGYELLSNFGRSILRPALAWGALVALFAAIYLGISAEISGRAPDYASLAPIARAQPCLSAPAVAPANIRTAQGQIAADTNASAEAWSLALKNGFVFIDWDRAEAARRTYGCLFGLTGDGSNTYPVVPRAVSIAGLIQNVLSAVLIFLLLLGIRNLLKLK